jgi:RING finger protein 113A
MFRKSKKTVAAKALRKRSTSDDENGNSDKDDDTSNLIREARDSFSTSKKPKHSSSVDTKQGIVSSTWMHQYQTSDTSGPTEKDLATGTADHHPEVKKQSESTLPDDGIFRNTSRNPFLAGPLKATQFVRTTARFDYQPDVCKDYKETGFCGFGDTCIYLHDRGDTLSGWQLEQQWEEQKKKEMAQRELDAFSDGKELVEEKAEIPEDGLPFACFLCRDYFQDPVVTSCGHYFSEKCILNHVRNSEKPLCPVCNADTHGVFNQPTKLISKKRRLIGATASWQEFMECQKKSTSNP